MAGEIQLNGTTALTESSGAITLNNVDSATNRTNLGLGTAATSASTDFASSSSTITAGTGLSGGGDLSTNRTINVSFSANESNVKTAINASGSAPIYACRAWINFDGTSASIGTGRANGNVSGVTDNGSGDYTVTFATAMPDANYSVVCSGSMEDNNVRRGSSVGPRANASFNNAANSYSTASIRILSAIYGTSSLDPTLLDLDVVNVTILR